MSPWSRHMHRSPPFDPLMPRHLLSHWSDERWNSWKEDHDRWMTEWVQLCNDMEDKHGVPETMETTVNLGHLINKEWRRRHKLD